MKEEIVLLKKAIKILIEIVIEHIKPPEAAGYETFEKYQQQINRLNEIKSKLEEQ